MIRWLISLYSWRFPTTLVYMLQTTEYFARPYLKWFWHTARFDTVMYRRTLQPTWAARLLLLVLRLGMLAEIAAGLVLVYAWWRYGLGGGLAFGLAVLLAYPVVWAHLLVAP